MGEGTLNLACWEALRDCLQQCGRELSECGNPILQLHLQGVIPLGEALIRLKVCDKSHDECSRKCNEAFAKCQGRSPRDYFTPEQKRAYGRDSNSYWMVSGGVGLAATSASLAGLGAVEAAWLTFSLAELALVFVLLATVTSNLSIDPIDSNFAEIAQPSPPTPPHISPEPGTGIKQSIANAMNAMLVNHAEQVGFARALETSINRAQGAAMAGDAAAEKQQLVVARRYARRLATCMGHAASLRLRAASRLRSGGLAFSISEEDALNLRTQIVASGFPQQFQDMMAYFGIEDRDRDLVFQQLTRALFRLDVLTISFPEVLTMPEIASVEAEMVSVLRESPAS